MEKLGFAPHSSQILNKLDPVPDRPGVFLLLIVITRICFIFLSRLPGGITRI